MAKIIGVRYVGKKDVMEDTVTNSGATWKHGETHNFSETLARELLVHTDSFEESPPSMEGGVFMSGKVNGASINEPAAYVNLNAMSREQMTFYARNEFNRILNTDGKTDADLRLEIQSLMTVATLDEIGRDDNTEASLKVAVSVSEAELEALNAGTLKIRLVPAEAVCEQSTGITADLAQALIDEHEIDVILDNPEDVVLLAENAPVLHDAYVALREIAAGTVAEEVEEGTAPAEAGTDNPINSMNKAELLALAVEKGVPVNDRAPVPTLRKQLIEATMATVSE